jgi:hypothetical protein
VDMEGTAAGQLDPPVPAVADTGRGPDAVRAAAGPASRYAVALMIVCGSPVSSALGHASPNTCRLPRLSFCTPESRGPAGDGPVRLACLVST